VHAYDGRKEWVLVPNMVWSMVLGVGGGGFAFNFNQLYNRMIYTKYDI
jgi:hypothetical protein